MSGADALVESLKREKVNVIFGMPGGANLPMYDALNDSGIRHVLVRHEQIGAHMADGYARVAKRPGVTMGTSGPGATNLVTGIGTAYADSSPVIAITGQVPTDFIGKDAFQEADAIGIMTPITKYCFMPKSAKEIPETVMKGFHIANTGRPGPVLIDVPKDVQQGKADMIFPEKIEVRGYNPINKPDLAQIDKVADLLLSAEKPMIMSGGGVIIASAFQELQELANLIMSPVVTTFKGKGGFPENHPLSLGPIGMHGHPEANKLILEADVLLAIACRFSDRSVGKWDTFGHNMKIIHIDIDPSELGKNKRPFIGIVGDVRISLEELLKVIRKKMMKPNRTAWKKRCEELKSEFRKDRNDSSNEINPRRILRKLREVLPGEAVVTTEVGQCQMWASLYFDIIESGTFYTSTGLGTMGFGLPAAVGAKVARPNVPVLDIAGDGSFNMTEAALATSVLEDIPIIAVIMNNSTLGMVAQWQRLFYDRRYIGVDLKNSPDFVKLAQAYGAEGVRVGTVKEFGSAVKKALNNDVSTVIEVPISPEENVLPFVAPGTGLKDMIMSA